MNRQSIMLKKWLSSLGPGIITAALVFGPSKITIASRLGSLYGYSMLWVVILTIFFMTIFTAMSARIGMATEMSMLYTIRSRWGRAASLLISFGLFFVACCFQTGNAIGIGIALAALFQGSAAAWLIAANLIALLLLFFKRYYKLLEVVMIALILVMLGAFCFTVFSAAPAASSVIGGLVPSIPKGSSPLIIAFVASCFSIVAAFYQSYLVQEKKKAQPGIGTINRSFIGILILGILSALVMICSGTILYPRHLVVNSAGDMARSLEPALGSYASVIFLCGLAGASFSALIGNATLGGTLICDGLGLGSGLKASRSKLFIAAIISIGVAMAIIFRTVPIELIVFAQRITVLVVPFIATAMFIISNDTKLMGDLVNTAFQRISALVGLIVLYALAARTIYELAT